MSDPRKAIFDAVREVKPSVFTDPGNILALDNLLDAFGIARNGGSRRLGEKGKALIKRWEGCKLEAYPDPGTGGAPWTIGWGTTKIDGRPVRWGDRITQERADQIFDQQLARYAAEVSATIGEAPTSQEQFDALVSFHYNTGAIQKATLTRLHEKGDFVGAANEFSKWVNAGGKKMKGLVNRRAQEAELYRSGS